MKKSLSYSSNKVKVYDLRNEGKSFVWIAKYIGITAERAKQIFKRYEQELHIQEQEYIRSQLGPNEIQLKEGYNGSEATMQLSKENISTISNGISS